MRNPIEHTGFAAPAEHKLGREGRTVAFAELIATAALAVSTIVAATAVTMGIAHAEVGDTIIENPGSVFAVALLLGLMFIGLGGLTALTTHKPKH